MSNELVNWARKQKCPSSSAKFVLMMLADRCHKDSDCRTWPSLQTLAEDTQLDRRHVIRNLKALEAAGLITRERRNHPSGQNRSNVYLLNVVEGEGGLMSPTQAKQGGHIAPGGWPNVTSYKEPELEPKTKTGLKKREVAPTARPMVEIREDDPRVRALRAAKVKLVPTKRFTFMVPAEALAA